MRKADGLFLQCARDVASNYPDIKFEDSYLDTVCLRVSSGQVPFVALSEKCLDRSRPLAIRRLGNAKLVWRHFI